MTYKSKNAQRHRNILRQVRFSPEENASLEKLKEEWGASSVSEVIRMSVRGSLVNNQKKKK